MPVRLFYNHLMEEACGSPTRSVEVFSHQADAVAGMSAVDSTDRGQRPSGVIPGSVRHLCDIASATARGRETVSYIRDVMCNV